VNRQISLLTNIWRLSTIVLEQERISFWPDSGVFSLLCTYMQQTHFLVLYVHTHSFENLDKKLLVEFAKQKLKIFYFPGFNYFTTQYSNTIGIPPLTSLPFDNLLNNHTHTLHTDIWPLVEPDWPHAQQTFQRNYNLFMLLLLVSTHFIILMCSDTIAWIHCKTDFCLP
jgi:hypothetical protein